jgi:hypothetical protein
MFHCLVAVRSRPKKREEPCRLLSLLMKAKDFPGEGKARHDRYAGSFELSANFVSSEPTAHAR